MKEHQNDGLVEVFFSYAHEDEGLRDILEKHLTMLNRLSLIKCWHDRKISPGKEWGSEIDERLKTAHIILLLISIDFLHSDYCYGAEMGCALQRHESGEARVIPIILRECDWEYAPFAKFQALPKDAKPVNKWSDQDEAFTDVAKGIRKVVEEIYVLLKEEKKDSGEVEEPEKKQIFKKSAFTITQAAFRVGSNEYIVKGKMLSTPYVKNDRTYVPITYITKALSIDSSNILWNDTEQSLVIINGDRVIKLISGSNTMVINGIFFYMDIAPEIINGELMVPIRWVAQALGISVKWDAETMSIVFTTIDEPSLMVTFPVKLNNGLIINGDEETFRFTEGQAFNGYDANGHRLTNIVGFEYPELLKWCTHCGSIKKLSDFGSLRIATRTRKRDQSWCLNCRKG